MDIQFRRAILTSNYSFAPFFTRPICIILIVILIYMTMKEVPFFRAKISRFFKGKR